MGKNGRWFTTCSKNDFQNNKFYIQSGAGIVADSVPEKEYIETVNKAKALIKSLN